MWMSGVGTLCAYAHYRASLLFYIISRSSVLFFNNEAVNKFVQTVIALIEEYLDAETLCQAMEMCSSDEEVTQVAGECPLG